MDDIAQLDEKYSEEPFYYGFFLDHMMGQESKCQKNRFLAKLNDFRFAWLYDTYLLRQKILNKIQEDDEY